MVYTQSFTRVSLFSVALLVCIAALLVSSTSATPTPGKPFAVSKPKGYTRLPQSMTLRDYLKVPSGNSAWSKIKNFIKF
ncbi:uncharacterized protein UBRO_20456 [Ustilago bromivora]|uniref:Uncharacterized protein n=1 Tax=Ustilago bromivora TaxID=307758 RepID=A0A1K0FX19_9BASI|nr:uncharacterized protein UBRO_20456 [Ustilago bromivora]SYW77070.1 uncharacterized protein UBRO2_01693 [Ustilago bromivora]